VEFVHNNSAMSNDNTKRTANTTKLEYRLRSNTDMTFDISEKSCAPFGFYFGERVRVKNVQCAWVVGVSCGNLFFHIDGDVGASYYASFKKEEFERDGFELISPRLFQKRQKPPETHFAPQLAQLMEDSKFSDVTFLVGESEVNISAHKAILVCRSSYFKSMFCGGLKESHCGESEPIHIPNVEPDAFRKVLHFLYTGQVTGLDENNICDIFAEACKFCLDDLKSCCCTYIRDNLNAENITTFLKLAEETQDSQLRLACKEYVLQHYEDVMSDKTKWREFPLFICELLEDLQPKKKIKHR